jgi:hypothetical protein
MTGFFLENPEVLRWKIIGSGAAKRSGTLEGQWGKIRKD